MYLEKIVSKLDTGRPLILPRMDKAEALARKTINKTDQPVKILDKTVGTGRVLMSAYKRAPNSMLFGVDNDLRALRIAFTNLAIHDISGYLLHADCEKHELDIANDDGWYNWQYANRWYSCMDKLKLGKKIKKRRTELN
jgi:type I restriction-modification system DNA methylase subunit